ncbi:Protein Dr1 homolog [Striga hermonthica]|uniref:Protein Dr1 homolog n=1 Tax=Striga hermonthica TaxID=68872 RepID=A0A9N7NN19_STRHE|nr:Protein Dr1 homolog [Striga hermonthica]
MSSPPPCFRCSKSLLLLLFSLVICLSSLPLSPAAPSPSPSPSPSPAPFPSLHRHHVPHFTYMGRMAPRWHKRTLEYAFSPDHGINYLDPAEVRAVFARAFARWSAYIPVTFTETEDYEQADVKIGWYSGDHEAAVSETTTMTKIIKEMLPPDVRVARDTQDLLIECCVEFINLISSESNEVCNREDRKTIAPEHVLKALEVLGFAEYIEEVYAAYEQHRLETMDTMRGGKWSNVAEMTEEEALAEQQKMFAEARARMNGGPSAPKQPSEPHNQPTPNS